LGGVPLVTIGVGQPFQRRLGIRHSTAVKVMEPRASDVVDYTTEQQMAVRGITDEEPSMNWDRVAGNWKQFKGRAKQQWGKLTDDDLDVAAGKRDELAGKVQERYGVAKDEAERQVDEWQKSIKD
jgi:uncharacterized protein YjbJ (UPF0337 family)